MAIELNVYPSGKSVPCVKLGDKNVMLATRIEPNTGYPVLMFKDFTDKTWEEAIEEDCLPDFIIEVKNKEAIDTLRNQVENLYVWLKGLNPCEDYQWNDPTQLPTPEIPLVLKLKTGELISGVRPQYIETRTQRDLGYRDEYGLTVEDVIGWAYK